MNLWEILLIFAASTFTLILFVAELGYFVDLEDEHEFMQVVIEKAIKDDAQKMSP